MNKRFTVEESNLISIFMEEGIDSVGNCETRDARSQT